MTLWTKPRWLSALQVALDSLSDGTARLLCYVCPPFAGALLLTSRHNGHLWSIRFHAVHSMLLAAMTAVAIGTLHVVEAVSPWFVRVLAKDVRWGADLAFAIAWGVLMWTAYDGTRCAVVPSVHMWAVKLARRYERRVETV
ncbi:MAG TPA: hypothetical protein VG871_00585 [Vicinamibacterales bacterium]|nr:hypothetical protein [Vicinamibacterales bacterium]